MQAVLADKYIYVWLITQWVNQLQLSSCPTKQFKITKSLQVDIWMKIAPKIYSTVSHLMVYLFPNLHGQRQDIWWDTISFTITYHQQCKCDRYTDL